MPTYEYACRECGQHLEVVQSFTDDPLETCERCGGRLRKVFSAAGIIFKGSGYYVTDTRKGRGEQTSTASSATSTKSSEDSSSGSSGSAGSAGSAGSSKATGPGDSASSSTTDSKSA